MLSFAPTTGVDPGVLSGACFTSPLETAAVRCRRLGRAGRGPGCQAYTERPLTDGENALAEIADWGPAEDWADWADAAR